MSSFEGKGSFNTVPSGAINIPEGVKDRSVDFHNESTGDIQISMGKVQEVFVERKRGDPFPVCMLAFGMCNILMGIYQVRNQPVDYCLIADGMLFGGVVQVIGGILFFTLGETLDSYGCFMFGSWWLAVMGLNLVGAIETVPIVVQGKIVDSPIVGDSLNATAWFSFTWLWFLMFLFAAYCSFGRKNIAAPLTLLFVCGAALSNSVGYWILNNKREGDDTAENIAKVFANEANLEILKNTNRANGVFMILSGIVGWYQGMARLYKETYGRTILPVGF